MTDREGDQGRQVHQNAGIGQERVDEAGPAPRQTSRRPPTAGGPGSGSGATAKANNEDQQARSGPDVYGRRPPDG